MFLIKKIVSAMLLPYSISLFLLGVGVLMLWFSSRRRLAQALVTISAFGFFLLSYGGWWNFLVDRLEYKYPVFDSDRKDLDGIGWIVVLGGGGVRSDVLPAPSQLNPQSLARLTEGVRIWKTLPNCKILYSGDSDGLIIKKVAPILGVDPERLVIENKAKDTAEEAVVIRRMIGAERIVLVTSAIHMPRAMALLVKQGMTPVPAPADFLNRHTNLESAPGWGGFRFFPSSSGGPKSDAIVHEYLGLLWGRLWGQV
jgi:uncharacterized SAM-binding protein YcdF (DUF218 family)